jgi:large subunit ribosomal protein L30
MARKTVKAEGSLSGGKILVRLVRSTIGAQPRQRATVKALGLRKIHSLREHAASPAILGMVKAVSHLVSVEEASNTKGV